MTNPDAIYLRWREMEWSDRAAIGTHPAVTANIKFGQNADIDTTTDPEDVWDGGGIYTGQPVGDAETVEVFSSSTADDVGGTGAITVEIDGLDANWAVQKVVVTLDGTTAVPTTETWQRVYRLKVLTAGTGGQNAGTLTVRHTTTTANVFCIVPVGANQSRVCAFTVPADQTALIKSVYISLTEGVGAANAATVSLRIRDSGGVYRSVLTQNITSSYPLSLDFTSGLPVAAKADLKVSVESVAANNSVVTGSIEYFVIEEDA